MFLNSNFKVKIQKVRERIENHANPSNIHIHACVLGVEN